MPIPGASISGTGAIEIDVAPHIPGLERARYIRTELEEFALLDADDDGLPLGPACEGSRGCPICWPHGQAA
jgi:hypothetical protein